VAGEPRSNITGKLLSDPKAAQNKFGDRMVCFRLGIAYEWLDPATKERKDNMQEHQVVIWDPTVAGFAERVLRRGMKVKVEGCLQSYRAADQNGEVRKSYEIVIERDDGKLSIVR